MVAGQIQQKHVQRRQNSARRRFLPLFERFGVFRFSYYCCTPGAQF